MSMSKDEINVGLFDRVKQLETERDEAIRVAKYWQSEASKECTLAQRANKERDELRAEVARAEAKTLAEYEAHRMTQCEREALRAEANEWKRRHENAVKMLHTAEEDCTKFRSEVAWLKTSHAMKGDK